jgi:FixJ family two-component response regulator
MGMTYEQYWDMSPYLVIAYRKAYKLKREIANEQAWLQGLYVYDAFAVCMANAFAKRGAKKVDYLEKPVDIFPLTDAEKERREQEERDKMQKAMEAIASKQRRKKKQG